MTDKRFSGPRALLACATLLAAFGASGAAHAQYSWIDEHGTHVFSDRPPQGTRPVRNLKTPQSAIPPARDAAAAAPSTGAASPATPATAAGTPPAPPSLADRDADFRKRSAQREADERKAADEAKVKAAQAEQCANARRNEATLNSGARVADVDSKGERAFLTDEEKARRLARTRQALTDCR